MDRGFKILGVNHIGLAPKSPSQTRNFFSETLGLAFFGDELVASQKTLTAMFDSQHQSSPAHANLTRLEVLEPDQGKGPIAAFLAKKGSGIHHIALQVDSVDAALTYLKQKNIRLIDEVPRPGAHHTRIAFIHPEATGGLLVELVEEQGK